MSKHTKAPWAVNPKNFTEVLADGHAPMNTVVANCPGGLDDSNLIASSPDLLSALIRISAAYSNLETAKYADYEASASETARSQIADAIKASRYVIAKATGGKE